jgi:iron complex transport system permease protein
VAPALVLLLGVAAVASITIGSTRVPLLSLVGDGPDQAVAAARLTRTVLALLVGASLGVAGACLQGLTRNPLADPALLGLTTGASFAMVVGIQLLGLAGLPSYVWAAFTGTAVTGLLVHLVASRGPVGATPTRLVVTGAAFSALLSAWVSAVLLVDRATMDTFRFWAVGTVGGRTWDTIATIAPFVAVGLVVALGSARLLDRLALGDDLAVGLGGRPLRDRAVVGAAVVLLTGAATAAAGPVGFVGLVGAHAARILVGPGHTRLLPTAGLVGAILVVLADTVGRVVLPPTEVQVGIMTAVLGVPAFLVLLRGRGVR